MPVLDLARSVRRSQDVSDLEVLAFGPPADVREWMLGALGCCDCRRNCFLLHVED